MFMQSRICYQCVSLVLSLSHNKLLIMKVIFDTDSIDPCSSDMNFNGTFYSGLLNSVNYDEYKLSGSFLKSYQDTKNTTQRTVKLFCVTPPPPPNVLIYCRAKNELPVFVCPHKHRKESQEFKYVCKKYHRRLL